MGLDSVSANLSTIANRTSPPVVYLGFGAVLSVTTAIWCIIILLNGAVLCQFARNSRLRTPFAVYLECLVGSHFIYGILMSPFAIINGLYTAWTLSSQWCTVYLYISYVLQAGVQHSHVLISLNRVWAVTFPLSYRRNHTKELAYGITAAMWIYVHIMVLPGIVLDGLYYRIPLQFGCRLNPAAQPAWALILQFLIFDTPNLLMAISYPLVCYRHFQQKKVLPGRSVAGATGNVRSQEFSKTNIALTPIPSSHSHFDFHLHSRTHSETHSNTQCRSKRSESKSFLILTLLTVGVLICWTPMNVVFTVLSFADLPAFGAAVQTVFIVYSIQPVLDPLFFIASLKDLRRSFTCGGSCRCQNDSVDV